METSLFENNENLKLLDLSKILADTAELSDRTDGDPACETGHLVDGSSSEELCSRTALVEARCALKRYRTLIVQILNRKDSSVERKIPLEDYDAVIQSSNVVVAAYLICITNSTHLAKSYPKYFDEKRIDKARDRLIERVCDYISFKYDQPGIDHEKKCYWADFFKYKFMAFYAYWLGKEKELPSPIMKNDLPNVILGGLYGKVLHRLKHNDVETFDLLVETVNYLKKGMPAVSPQFVHAKVEETFRHLSNEDNKNFESSEIEYIVRGKSFESENFVAFDTNMAIVECVRTTKELFSKARMSYDMLIKPFVGSVNSSFDNSKQRGGQALYISQILEHMDLPDHLSDFLELEKQMFDVVGRLQEKYGEESRDKDSIMKLNLNPMTEPVSFVPGFTWSDRNLNLFFEQLFWNVWHQAVDEVNYATPVGLAEPLKVRVIMKGRASKYFVMRPFQKWMHGHLRKHPNLVAIGKPITQEMVNNFFREPKDFQEFVNGDYQQSTNLLFSSVSEAIGNELVGIFLNNFEGLEYCHEQDPHFETNLRKMVIDCLIHHMIQFGKDDDHELREQTTGQSMGSPVSFPVLCIANLAGARKACEIREKRKIRLGPRFKCWVNGDDVTFKSLQNVYPVWIGVMKCFGLYTSPGKTFNSECSEKRHFIMLNSMRFQWNDVWKMYELIPFVNFGVLLAKKKSVAQSDSVRTKAIFELASLQKDLLGRAPLRLNDFLNQIFIKLHKEVLSSYKIPWFLPTWVGGLGLSLTESFEVSDWDRRMATLIKKNWNMGLRPRNIFSESSWWMWRNATASIESKYDVPFVLGRLIRNIQIPFEEITEITFDQTSRDPIGYSLTDDVEFKDLAEAHEDFLQTAAVASFFVETKRFLNIKKLIEIRSTLTDDNGKLKSESVNNDIYYHGPQIEELNRELLKATDVALDTYRKLLPECFSFNKKLKNYNFEVIDVKDQTQNLKYNEKIFKKVNQKLKKEFLLHHPMSDLDLLKEKKAFCPPVKKL